MPTPGGLPKAGEVWSRTFKDPTHDWAEQTIIFRVHTRGSGAYWSLRVRILEPQSARGKDQLWVDASYWYSLGELKYIRD